MIDPQRVEGLLSQGAIGHHLLFDLEQIRRGLSGRYAAADHAEALDDLQGILVELTECEGLHEQRAVISALSEEMQDLAVRMYFHFLDRYIREQPLTWH